MYSFRTDLCKLRKHLSVKNSTHLCRAATSVAAQALHSNSHAHSVEEPFFPEEPRQPAVQTEIPGAKAREAIARLDKIYDTRSLNMMANYDKSFGN